MRRAIARERYRRLPPRRRVSASSADLTSAGLVEASRDTDSSRPRPISPACAASSRFDAPPHSADRLVAGFMMRASPAALNVLSGRGFGGNSLPPTASRA